MTLDLQTQAMLRSLELAHVRYFQDMGVKDARRSMDLLSPVLDFAPRREVPWHDRYFPGPGGDLPMRVYDPQGVQSPAPLLLYFHGGGFVLGSHASHHGLCSYLAERGCCKVAHVEYRLAPEHPFPAAFDDVLASFQWVAAHAAELGCDPQRLAMGGDSAGANLTAAVTLQLRDAQVRPALQLLIYPAVDFTRSFESHQRFAEGFYMTRSMIDWFLDNYLTSPEQKRDPRASPWFAEDVRGVPPALILTAGFDALRDEGKAWAGRLSDAGVHVEHRCVQGCIHGFASMAGAIDAAREGIDWAGRRLAESLAR